MNVPDLVKKLVEAGANPEAISVAVQAVEHFRNLPESSGKATKYEWEIWRKVERERKRVRGKKPSKISEKTEAPESAAANEISSPEFSGNVIALPLTNNKQEGIQGKEERKKKSSENTRARGVRLPDDWQPTEADRKFARDNGISPDWLRDEFVDFWTSIPGVRGLKLDWSKTWRTRVRAIAGNKKFITGGQNGSAATRKDRQSAVIDRLSNFGSGCDPAADSFPEGGAGARS